jgi:hypothetical protein
MTISMQVRLLFLACSLVSGRVAFSQTFGSIDGEARDATGAAVAGVTVSATNLGTNAARTAITNDAGAYAFPSLAPNVSTGSAGQGQAGARQGGNRAAQTIAVAGQPTNFNRYTLDGVENTDPNSRLQRGEKCA